MKLSCVILLLFTSVAFAQQQDSSALHKGTMEVGFWTGGGRGVNGSTKGTELFVSGIRLGKVLTADHGGGFFRGNLEYLIETIPVFVIFQENTTAGFDFTPFLMKWNFSGAHKRPVAFFEWGAGTLFTSSKVPTGTSRFNFTPQGGFGLYLFSHPRRAATIEVKYMHISSGGLERPNPGINSVHVLLGYGWYH